MQERPAGAESRNMRIRGDLPHRTMLPLRPHSRGRASWVRYCGQTGEGQRAGHRKTFAVGGLGPAPHLSTGSRSNMILARMPRKAECANGHGTVEGTKGRRGCAAAVVGVSCNSGVVAVANGGRMRYNARTLSTGRYTPAGHVCPNPRKGQGSVHALRRVCGS